MMACSYPRSVEDIRSQEYPVLHDVTYLDHAGTTLYPQSLIDRFSKDMRSNLFGNPHSASPSSALSTVRVEGVRARLLNFFKADPEHFDLVFVANCTAAIKLVIDCFRDAEDGFWYGYHRDAHTSIVGVRQLAKQSRCFGSDDEVDDWIGNLNPCTELHETNLFAYPAQSNMNGHRTPLEWSSRIRQASPRRVYTLLDTAAYAMTAQLDLSNVESAPDFTTLSLYKIFGFPDLGVLIVRKSAGDILRRRRYFGGGTVDMVIAMQQPWHALKDEVLHERLEDGTLPFHSIVALDSALDVFHDLYGSMNNVSKHTCSLSLSLYNHLTELRHFNNVPVCEIHRDSRSQYGDGKTQGPTLAFNIRNSQGGWIGKSDVEKLAILHGIHLRTGGVCNPGGIATFCDLQAWEMLRNFSEGMRCGDDLDILGGKPTGIVRVSLGAMSSLQDVIALVNFVKAMFVETEDLGVTSPSRFAFGVTSEAQLTLSLSKLQIFPIVDCAAFEIPHQSWAVDSAGLAWDHEWCIVSRTDYRPLAVDFHPRLRTIKPSLDVERGILKLVAPTPVVSDTLATEEAVLTIMKEQQLTVSLWDTPTPLNDSDRPQGNLSSRDQDPRPADPYASQDISNFFTSVLGVPCTLARFQHLQRFDKSYHHIINQPHAVSCSTISEYSSRHLTVSFQSLDVTASTANITISHPYPHLSSEMLPSSQHLRIAAHVFQLVEIPASELSHSRTALKFLRNSKDRSLRAQTPTIAAGDLVEVVTTFGCGWTDKDMCENICPVWDCRTSFPSADSLDMHLKAHVRMKVYIGTDTASTRPIFQHLIQEDRVQARPNSRKISHTPSPSGSSTGTTTSSTTAVTMSSLESAGTTETCLEILSPGPMVKQDISMTEKSMEILITKIPVLSIRARNGGMECDETPLMEAMAKTSRWRRFVKRKVKALLLACA